MKTFKTAISIVCIVGAIAIIVYDGKTNVDRKVITKPAKVDSLQNSLKK